MRKSLGQASEAFAGENRDDEPAGRELGETLVEAGELLRFAGEHDSVSRRQQRREFTLGGDAGSPRQHLGGVVIATDTGNLLRSGRALGQQSANHG